jgi:hypothetical protein
MAITVLSACEVTRGEEHDIHFLAEHVPESGMDARYMSLPWPGAQLAPDEWQQIADVGTAHTRTDFMDLDGPLVALAAVHGLSTHWGYELLGFHGHFTLSGEAGRAPLTPSTLQGVPLDLPQLADFSAVRGTVRHDGLGAAVVHTRETRDAAASSAFIAGVLLDRFAVTGFGMDYRIVGGAEAGTSGRLEYSASTRFVTPFIAWQRTRMLSKSWAWSPRATFLLPEPAGDFRSHLTGPDFDIASPSGSAIQIGDGFFTAGLALEHRPTGIEIDLGGMLLFATATERLSHPGVERAEVLHVTWRHRSR